MSEIEPDPTTRLDRNALRLGEQMDLGRIAIKAAMHDIDRLATALQREGVSDQLTGTYGALHQALRAYETAAVVIAHELALKLEESLPSHEKEATP